MQTEELRRAAGQIRMIVLDLDGTAMNDQHAVTPRTRAVLAALLERGYLVVPASGRGYCNVKQDVLPGLAFPYMIAANGALVVEYGTGKLLFEELIPCRVAARLVTDFLDDEENCLYVHYLDGKDTHRKACPSESAFQRYYARPWDPPQPRYSAQELRDLILEDGKGIPKIGLWFQRDDGFARYETRAALRYPEVHSLRVGENSLEFCSAAAGKAVALRRLCGLLGVAPDQVCALGDNGNDVEMLRYAGLGVAMENAILPARQAARHLAGHNDREGAARFLEEAFL